jgi:hypothetical protein
MKKILLSTIVSGAWIGASEFLRNEVMFKHYWLGKYAALGQSFPSEPVNNVLWAAWGFLLAGGIAFLVGKMTIAETIVTAWIFAFVMMWIVLWNLNVLPVGLLPIAIPWSIAEIAGAVFIARRIQRSGNVGHLQ